MKMKRLLCVPVCLSLMLSLMSCTGPKEAVVPILIPTPVLPDPSLESDCPRERQETWEGIIKEQDQVIECEQAKNAAQREFRRSVLTPSSTDDPATTQSR